MEEENPAEEEQEEQEEPEAYVTRSEQVELLLENLKGEMLVHIPDQKIPAFLRIDKDVKEKRARLR